MIISPTKAEDMRWRLELLNQMESDIRNGRTVTARTLGTMTAYLAKRIKEHDYTSDDSVLRRFPLTPIAICTPPR